MRLNFRHGIVSHQLGGFLQLNISNNIDVFATNRPVVVTIAHHDTDYLHSEDIAIQDAWIGPFSPIVDYWLYWEFDFLNFDRSFGFTTLEPVAQSIAPGATGVDIIQSVPGSNNQGHFIVDGHFVVPASKPIAVSLSTGNDGMYTIVNSIYNSVLGETTLYVAEVVLDNTADGEISLDIDVAGIPLLTEGRMWYDTSNHIHYELKSGIWVEVLRVFAARLTQGNVFLSHSIDGLTLGSFTGTQIGNTTSTLTGRVLFTENSNVIKRDDRTFLTTEDQFFTNQSRVDAIRLESNVARGQNIESSLAQFSIVTWVDEGKIGTAQYNSIGTSVVGILTEDILFGEVGAVIIQGVVTNPNWNWTSGIDPILVGSPLWVDNGILVATDPHIVDVLTFGTGRVPVARVLDRDTIIFEQGLGGTGDKGPPGSLEDLPAATTIELGAVTLVTPSSDPQRALVISDTDPRLTDARAPLPHNHTAIEILFSPAANLTSNNVQLALEELGLKKLDLAGGTLTGPLTLSGNPTTNFQATTKQYVDGLVSGLVWLDPICVINLISDTETTPPTSPPKSDAYIVPPSATGAWSAIPAGHVVVWDGSVWLDRGALTAISPAPIRLGIAMQSVTIPTGSFAGKKNQIAIYDSSGSITAFQIPTNNNAVYVCSESSLHAFNQFAFSGTDWILFGGAQSITADGITTALSLNILAVKQFDDGGINDVKFWQGLEPADLALTYSPLSHTHIGSQVTLTPYLTSPDWGTLSNPTMVQLLSTNVQDSLNELMDKKATKRPTYATLTDAPSPNVVEGMVIHVRDVDLLYYASNSIWIPIAIDGGPISLPYDIAFSVSGILQQNTIVGSFVSTRNITISANAPGSLAFANDAATDGSYTLAIVVKSVGGTVSNNVGTVLFNLNSKIGIITVPSQVDLVPGDVIQLTTDSIAPPDSGLKNVGVSLVGCSVTTQC